jgi:hypothetical protein
MVQERVYTQATRKLACPVWKLTYPVDEKKLQVQVAMKLVYIVEERVSWPQANMKSD